MSVTIRLARIGKRNAPAFKIVVANTRDKRNGNFLDVLGHYNPSHNPPLFSIDKKKFDQWKSKGALHTEAVNKLIEGTYKFVPYKQNKDLKGKIQKEPAEIPEEQKPAKGENKLKE